jgi:hypothetical protein
MLTNAQRAARLRMAIEALHNADAWVQEALGATDSCYDTHCGIEELIDDLQADIEDLEARAEGGVL